MVKKGQKYRVDEDITITCMTSWRAPFTGGHDRILRANEEFIIANSPRKDAGSLYADPVNYKKLHKKFVPWTDRIKFFLYRGYYLCIEIKKIEESCSLISRDSR